MIQNLKQVRDKSEWALWFEFAAPCWYLGKAPLQSVVSLP
ncbi:hypothetical protein PAGA_a1120 [Pseudoalteromonas agarivorans DSM 14585]|uniref:Uncharacterized protein n=1 Tax=Pseudoalteromonas agarivorans DSM 14585 TaxID=1312369 RepID=A0ACA8DU17_9GAMM|nr:hypothetical protein PAGA_a1120 [Pseudoalteromonas agarivorans DSM 14585]